jgi:hypothetical protein
MDRHCIKCNDKLVIGDNWTQKRKEIYLIECSDCLKKRRRAWYLKNKERVHDYNNKWMHSHKDGLYHIYVVDNYAGLTRNVYRRYYDHKTFGRDVSTFRVLHTTPDRKEAYELEALLHSEGYEGKARP